MQWEGKFNKKPLKISDPKKGKLNLCSINMTHAVQKIHDGW